jgi:hypothetical protein
MGRLAKMEFLYHTLIVCLGSKPYVHCDTSGRTFGLETVRLCNAPKISFG